MKNINNTNFNKNSSAYNFSDFDFKAVRDITYCLIIVSWAKVFKDSHILYNEIDAKLYC